MIRGFICGAFDLLHAGHIFALSDAKKHCDYLIVGLHVDPSIERKGKEHPVESVLERQIKLNACEYVDEVVVYETEQDILTILNNFAIDIRFLGGDYLDRQDEISGKDLVPIHYLFRKHPYSSSALRKKLR